MTSDNSNPVNVSRSPFGRLGIAVAILAGVILVHAAIDLALFKAYEVPPFYDAANHFNLAADTKEHFDRFEPTLKWLDELYDLSTYYPPCYHWLAGLSLKYVSFTLDGARLPNLLFLAILIYSVFSIGYQLFDTRTGLLAGVLIALVPVVHGLAREIYIDLALLSWTACAVALLLASKRFQNHGFSFLFGLVCGFGLLTKWTFPVFIGGPVLWVFAETFVPFSVFGLILGGVASGFDDRRLAPVERLLLTLGGWILLLSSLAKLFGGGALFLPWTIGAFLGTGALWYAQSGRAAKPDFSAIAAACKRPIPPIGKSLLGIALASLPALALAGPWYVKHWGFISFEGARVLTEAAEVRGMARVGTFDSFLYYFITLESHQLHLFYWLLAAAALVGLFLRRRLPASIWFLAVAFGVSYLVMSSLWVKDPRYFTPGIYPLPILMAWWLLARDPAQRPAWIAAAVMVGAIGLINQTIGLPGLQTPLHVPTPFGQPLKILGPGVYGDLIKAQGEWPHRKIVEDLARDASTQRHLEKGVVVPLLVDDGFLHAPAMNCYARVLGKDLQFTNIAYTPDYRTDPGFTTRLLQVLESPYFITKEGGSLGLDFVTDAYRPLLERLLPEDSPWNHGAEEMQSYPLPLGGSACVWRNDFPAAEMESWEDRKVSFENGVDLQRVRLSRRDPLVRGNPTLLQVDWKPSSPKDLRNLLEDCQFFLHIEETSSGKFMDGWNFPLSTETPEVAAFHLESGQGAVRSTLLFEPRADLPPGFYRLRLGIFLTSTLAKVNLADSVGSEEKGFLLKESFAYQPQGWQSIGAAFEDREMLAVRDRIGSVVLEAARVSPPSASPGADLLLETQWSLRDLELETPQEQDVWAAAYLLPAVADGKTKPVAMARWTLDAFDHSQPKGVRWTDRTLLSVPSDLEDGEWKVHIAVERPQFERQFAIRNGDQRDRKVFALENPVRVGLPDWEPVAARYPNGLRLAAARITNATLYPGSDLKLEISWSADSASPCLRSSTQAILFAHLFSLQEGDYRQLENLPLCDPKQIPVRSQALEKNDREAFFEAVHTGFTERYTLPLQNHLLPGKYRLDFGVYLPGEGVKETALLPNEVEATTFHFPNPLILRTP